MSLAECYGPFLHAVRGFYFYYFVPLGSSAVTITVAVVERVFRIIKGLQIQISNVRIVYRQCPAEIFVMSYDGQDSETKAAHAGNIQAFVTMEMSLIWL